MLYYFAIKEAALNELLLFLFSYYLSVFLLLNNRSTIATKAPRAVAVIVVITFAVSPVSTTESDFESGFKFGFEP